MLLTVTKQRIQAVALFICSARLVAPSDRDLGQFCLLWIPIQWVIVAGEPTLLPLTQRETNLKSSSTAEIVSSLT